MKKQILLFLALIMSIVASAQVTIQMEKEGGVYKVPCTVNGVKMKFVFDTGASTVCISQSMAQFLLDGGYLSANDIVGKGQSYVADGSLVNHVEIVLRDVEIGGMHIRNVKAVVIEGQNASLLLGQTAISELGRVTIDGNKLVIHAIDNELTEEQIDLLDEQIGRLIEADSYTAAVDCLLKMEAADGLSEYGLYLLCQCYNNSNQYQNCINACKRWLGEYETNGEEGYKMNVYGYLASSYHLGMKDYNSAILWYQKELDILENSDLADYYNPGFFEQKKNLWIANGQFFLADCYDKLNMSYRAVSCYKQAIKLMCQYMHVTMDDVKNGKVHDDDLGFYLYSYALCYYKQNKESDGDEIMKLAALCESEIAIDFCRKYNINYQVKSSKLFD